MTDGSTSISNVKSCIIGTRESKLALWQAYYTQNLLKVDNSTTFNFVIQGITTLGDKDQKTALSQFSKQGIFTKELDIALLQHTIDCAVHCVKDLPTELPQGLIIASYLPRGKTNDCCIVDKIKHPNVFSFENLPKNSKIGTGSLRRQSILRSKFKDFSIEGIRGNLNTRLRKLVEDKLYDAIILAQIGIERLGWIKNNSNINEKAESETKSESAVIMDLEKSQKFMVDKNSELVNIFSIDIHFMPYAVGQGSLAIVCRQTDIQENPQLFHCFLRLNNLYAQISCEMERSLLRCLHGGCKVPIACRSYVLIKCRFCRLWNCLKKTKCDACFEYLLEQYSIDNNSQLSQNIFVDIRLILYGTVLSCDGKIRYETQESVIIGNVKQCDILLFQNEWQHSCNLLLVRKAIGLGKKVANALINQGADKIIQDIKQNGEEQR